MDRDRAIALVGYLVASTTGWNDDSVLVYAAEVEKLSRPDVAATAIQTLARNWTRLDVRRSPRSSTPTVANSPGRNRHPARSDPARLSSSSEVSRSHDRHTRRSVAGSDSRSRATGSTVGSPRSHQPDEALRSAEADDTSEAWTRTRAT